MIYDGIYALIYLHTILGEGMDSRDGLPRGVLPVFWKLKNIDQAIKFLSPVIASPGYSIG